MKILLNICIIVWAASVFGRSFLPSIFDNYYTFWAIHLILAAILPIGFAKSLVYYFQQENKTIRDVSYFASFIFVFLMVLILPVAGHHNFTALKTYFPFKEPMFSVRDSAERDNEESRKFEAAFLFRQYGIKIPYRLDSGKYVIHEPTKDEIVKYNEKLKTRNESIELGQKINRMAISSSKVAIVHVLSFFILFVATIVYEQRSENTEK